jgi:pimeloyl-ACP methyl ester carboxylesterase
VWITGAFDDNFPPYLAMQWTQRARQEGDSAELQIIEGAGHFDVAATRSPAWVTVRTAVLAEVHRLSLPEVGPIT